MFIYEFWFPFDKTFYMERVHTIKMFYRLKKGKLREIALRAITKAGSERKLAKLISIPKGSIYALKFEKRNLSEKYSEKLCDYLKIGFENLDIEEILSDNWGQIKGGNNLIKKKKTEGTFKETISRLKKSSSKRMKKWHRHMKKNEPEKYHTWQYERFKKIGKGYQFSLINGIKVRNLLEKMVGDFLCKNIDSFDYEPYMNIKGKAYFPDFVYNKTIIEVTEWKNPSVDKINKLKRKEKDYKKEGYNVVFFIPRLYRKFYKGLNSPVISALPELKETLLMPL